MKSKIVFFLLGAMVTTISYSLAELKTETTLFEKDVYIQGRLILQGELFILPDFSDFTGTPSIVLQADEEAAHIMLSNPAPVGKENFISIFVGDADELSIKDVSFIQLEQGGKSKFVKVD